MRKLTLAFLFTSALAALSACNSKPAATCENVGEHIKTMMLSSDELKKQPADQQKVASTMVESLKAELTKECKDKKWDTKTIDCILSAKKMDDMEKCQPAGDKK
jgi:small lipoprotein (TIGR04454 family)